VIQNEAKLDNLPLFTPFDKMIEAPATGSLVEKFNAFHAANPMVYKALVTLARRMKQRGITHLGMVNLYEVMRWEWSLATSDPDGWRCNNNHRAYYARMITDREPDLRGMFETRQTRSERGN
jgi:hypothetical protein